MYWSSSCGRIELNITKKQAKIGSHQGACDEDIKYLRTIPAIYRQLNKISPAQFRGVLSEYGAWTDEEIANIEDSKDRLLWIACSDIVEELP